MKDGHVVRFLRDDGFEIEGVDTLEKAQEFMSEIDSSPSYNFKKDIIVVSSGSLKEEVLEFV